MKFDKRIIIPACILIAGVAAGIGYYIVTSHQADNTPNYTTITTNNVQGEETKKSDVGLPDPTVIDEKKTPVMWDFVNGTLGYKSDFTSNGGYNWAIAIPNTVLSGSTYDIFVSPYFSQDTPEPSLGGKPELVTLTPDEASVFKKYVENISPSNKTEEGDYTFIRFNEISENNNEYDKAILQPDATYTYANIKLPMRDTSKLGILAQKIYDGYGYPQDYLMKEPYEQRILTMKYVDITTDFFEANNYLSYKTYTAKDKSVIKVKVTGNDQYTAYENNSKLFEMNGEQLKQFLESRGVE